MLQEAVQNLIHDRFDIFNSAEPTPAPVSSIPTNGHSKPVKQEQAVKQESTPPISSRPVSSPPQKLEPDEDAEPPKKKLKKSKVSDDAKLAALLQAQENQGTRATRGGNKKAPKKPRKKSEKKIKASDDSGVDEVGSDGEVKEKPKKGGFHKEYYLSAPLAELVNETKVNQLWMLLNIWWIVKNLANRVLALSTTSGETDMGVYQSTRFTRSG